MRVPEFRGKVDKGQAAATHGHLEDEAGPKWTGSFVRLGSAKAQPVSGKRTGSGKGEVARKGHRTGAKRRTGRAC